MNEETCGIISKIYYSKVIKGKYFIGKLSEAPKKLRRASPFQRLDVEMLLNF